MIEIYDLLRAARNRFGMDVAFVGQFVGDRRLIRYVEATAGSHFSEGRDDPLEGSLCKLIAEGRIAGAIPNTARDAMICGLQTGYDLPIGAHLGVPIRKLDGSVSGTLCCFAFEPRPALDVRDLAALELLADVVAASIERDDQWAECVKERRIEAVMTAGGPMPVYQPVFMIDDLRIAGAEALSRFPSSDRAVDLWFKDAADVGVQIEFELLAIRNALRGYRPVWDRHRAQLGLNASTATVIDERFRRELHGYPLDLIVVELTEHERVDDYDALLHATQRLRGDGAKIAIDDLGAGYASMRHVLTIRPDILKLDIGLIRSIDADDLRMALTSSLKHFADQFSCRVVAEGVETEEELSALRDLQVQAAQGYLLSRPLGVDMLLNRIASARGQ